MKGKSLYIFSADCKDLIIPQYYKSRRRVKTGRSMLNKRKEYNLRRFVAALDFSLDQIRLREIYERVVGGTDFSFKLGRKQYTTHAINVTFKYAVREFNKEYGNVYVKLGCFPGDLRYEECVALVDGELAGIVLNTPAKLREDFLLPDCFAYVDGMYKIVKQPKVVVSTAEARKRLYKKGFWCDGVHYVRWKRSAGSARVGKCLFLNEALYPEMHRWEMCGLDVKDGDPIDLAALESYISLTSSSIIDVLDLAPENILVIDDYESVFDDEVVSVEEVNGKLTAERKVCTIHNSIWDGQGLIDVSAMGQYADKGMVLLRNQFFKCCCFNCNLQDWFRDNGITEIGQLNGRTKAKQIEDIKLVTTPSSIKFLKFGTLDEWLAHIAPEFGVVKYDKKTHFFDGRMVQVHYQLLNTLQMTPDEVAAFMEPTFDYMAKLRSDPAVLRHHIKYPIEDEDSITPAQSKNDVVYKMLGINDRFADTKLYYDFRADILKSFTKNTKLGHVLVNGNYSVLCGNPIEMLQAAIGKFDGTSQIGVGNLHSIRFDYGQKLLGSRSPHVSMGNVFLVNNAENPEIDRYMNPTTEIVYLNSIGESVLDRLSGCDFDSDTIMITNDGHLIASAEKHYGDFPVAAYNVVAKKISRHYTQEQKCDLDIKTSRNLIGEIVNTASEINSLIWDELYHGATLSDVESMYEDACLLNVMSNIEIDKAKKEFNVDTRKELTALEQKYRRINDGRKVEPNFFAAKDRGKGYYDPAKKEYRKHDTTMDYLQTAVNSFRMHQSRGLKPDRFLPFSDIVTDDEYNHRNIWKPKIERAVTLVRQSRDEIKSIYMAESYDEEERASLAGLRRQDCVDYVGDIVMSRNTMIYFLKHLEKDELSDIRRSVFNTLFGYPNSAFFELIRQSKEPIPNLIEDPDGDVELFGIRYRKTCETPENT